MNNEGVLPSHMRVFSNKILAWNILFILYYSRLPTITFLSVYKNEENLQFTEQEQNTKSQRRSCVGILHQSYQHLLTNQVREFNSNVV